MIRDLVDAVYRGDYRIELEFEDGQRGVVDFRKYVEKGGVFERLKDVEFFRGFSVNGELGTLTWADEIDIAPETLYAEATSSALPTGWSREWATGWRRLLPEMMFLAQALGE